MKNELLDVNNRKTGMYAANEQTTVDVGDVISLEHTDGIFFAEVVAIESGDAGEVLIFQYIKPQPEHENAPRFTIKRPFPK
jgi:hypothetical protein